MSLSVDRRFIVCDGMGCGATCPLPIALHPPVISQAENARPAGQNWLFARHQGVQRHYCPRCSRTYLRTLSERPREPAVSRQPSGTRERSRISPETGIGQLVAERPGRARVFEKYGMDYGCSGKMTLAEACRERHLEPQTLLDELSEADADPTSDDQDWLKRPLAELADHIVRTHHAYLRAALPRLTFLIGKVERAHGKRHPELARLAVLFAEMRAEIERHSEKEEQILFPLCKAIESGIPPANRGHIPLRNIVFVMEGEHDRVRQTLETIRALMHDYQPPADACPTYRVMLDGLAALETDVRRHVHKENHILFSRAVALEAECAETFSRTCKTPR
ncbi:MAG TPA: iron-sulfur cluster repair di-iron protein [Chthonomonadaceae bacterium]|nr:iron-sulfur cluster repair di-iron protein [Chthonomonadaceae bacterium]